MVLILPGLLPCRPRRHSDAIQGRDCAVASAPCQSTPTTKHTAVSSQAFNALKTENGRRAYVSKWIASETDQKWDEKDQKKWDQDFETAGDVEVGDASHNTKGTYQEGPDNYAENNIPTGTKNGERTGEAATSAEIDMESKLLIPGITLLGMGYDPALKQGCRFDQCATKPIFKWSTALGKKAHTPVRKMPPSGLQMTASPHCDMRLPPSQ